MLQTLRGIIFKTVKYSETSVICDIYTEELGLHTYILSGVRQQKSKIGPALVQPMSWVEMVVYQKQNKSIHRVKEIKPFLLYRHIPFDITKGAVGMFMIEIAQKTIRESESSPALFQFLFQSFSLLDQFEGKVSNMHLSFLCKLSKYLGFSPDFEYFRPKTKSFYFNYAEGIFQEEIPLQGCYFSIENSSFLLQFLQLSAADTSLIPMKSKERQDFIDALLKFYQYHTYQIQLKSHEVLHQVLAS